MTRCQCGVIFGDEDCGYGASVRVLWRDGERTEELRLSSWCAMCARHGWPDRISAVEVREKEEVRA